MVDAGCDPVPDGAQPRFAAVSRPCAIFCVGKPYGIVSAVQRACRNTMILRDKHAWHACCYLYRAGWRGQPGTLGMIKMTKRSLAAVAVVALAAIPCVALAVPVDLGSAGGYTLLATGANPNGTLILGANAEVYGNVGAQYYLGTSPGVVIHGNADYGYLNGTPTITGASTQQTSAAFWSALQADLNNASAAASAMTAGQTFGNITSTQTFNSYAGTSVFDLGGLNLNGGSLTLHGSSTDQFVINIGSGGLSMGAGASIVLDGVNPGNVLFNVTGNNTNFNVGAATLQGTFLGADTNVRMVLGDGLTLNGASFLSNGITANLQTICGVGQTEPPCDGGTPPIPVPEPSGLPFLGLGAALIGYLGYRRRKDAAAR